MQNFFKFCIIVAFPTVLGISSRYERQLEQTHFTAYNEQMARSMMALSAAAYAVSPNACIERWMPDPETWQLHTIENNTCDHLNNSCAFYTIVSEARREIVIVFRGTTSDQQLFVEGWQSLQPGEDFYGIGKVNKYFFNALNTLWPRFSPILSDPKYINFLTIFTGHSLGGAIASLASLKTVLEGLRRPEQLKMYTFGQPRVGCTMFAAKHNELVPNSFRVVFRKDIVPHLPPCAKNHNFPSGVDTFTSKPCDPIAQGIAYHHGIEIWYSHGMKPGDHYHECMGLPRGEDFQCSDLHSFEVTKYDEYLWDHRHYFDHMLSAFGHIGCDQNNRDMEEMVAKAQAEKNSAGGIFQNIGSKILLLGKLIGLL